MRKIWRGVFVGFCFARHIILFCEEQNALLMHIQHSQNPTYILMFLLLWRLMDPSAAPPAEMMPVPPLRISVEIPRRTHSSTSSRHVQVSAAKNDVWYPYNSISSNKYLPAILYYCVIIEQNEKDPLLFYFLYTAPMGVQQ